VRVLSFVHSKNTKVYVNGYNLTGYLDNISASGAASVAKTTAFSDTSNTYIAGITDATLQAEGFFDGSANAVDQVLQAALASQSVEWTWYLEGDAVGNYGYGILGVNNAYGVASTEDNACRVSAGAQSSVGLERVLSLHALGVESESDYTGTVQDNGASSSGGGSAYLHVTAATTGAAIEVIIEHSSDNFSGDTTTLVSFTNVTDRTSERVTFSGTVKQYVRAKVTLVGGESITFNIGICRK
jgi:hypothetical protein